MSRRITLWVCAFTAAHVLGCSRAAKPDLLIVVIDTLRPDRLGAYGSTHGLTPFLDSLAERSSVFRNAYAQTSWTNASIASLLTSRYQSQHRITSFKSVLAQGERTLAEVLKEQGYATAGFCANFLVLGDLGFNQGFDQYQTFARSETDKDGKIRYIKERAERVNREGLAWLDQVRPPGRSGPPIFLYLHYMEPHAPFDPPDALLERILDGRPRPDIEAVNKRMRLPNLGYFADEMVTAVRDLYDAEVMSIDAQLRALFTALQQRGFLDHAVVVILADHGEEFREHGLMGHHQTLFEEVIRVPLLITLPGQHRHVEITPIVSLTDVAPTLLDLAGVAAPPTFDGTSLRALMGIPPAHRWWPFTAAEPAPASPPVAARFAFSELIKETTDRQRPHERAVVMPTSKLILNVDGGHEYYDLTADPAETNPQGLADPVRDQLAGTLSRLDQLAVTHPTPRGTAAMDAETRERMRALGYTE